MDPLFYQLLASKLKKTTEEVTTAFVQSMSEFALLRTTTSDNGTTVVNSAESDHWCEYLYVVGKNKGKLCGKLPANINHRAVESIDGKYYCSTHLTTMKKRADKQQLKIEQVDQTIYTTPRVETELRNGVTVIKGTMLIVNTMTNTCCGSLRNGQPTDKISPEEKFYLDTRNIPAYNCSVVSFTEKKPIEDTIRKPCIAEAINLESDVEDTDPLAL